MSLNIHDNLNNDQKIQAVQAWLDLISENNELLTVDEFAEQLQDILDLPTDYFKPF